MPRLFFHLRDGEDFLLDPDGVELPDLAAAKAFALRNAYDLMAGEVQSGKLKLDQRIDVEDEAGNVLHTVRFHDLVEVTGLEIANPSAPKD